MIRFKNVMAKTRPATGPGKSYYIVGNELNDLSYGKIMLKSPFEKGLILHPRLMERLFDYAFAQLGNAEARIEHPVFMTEPLCNTLTGRENVTELLFECYQVPGVAYGVDSALAFYYNSRKGKAAEGDGLVVSLQNACSFVYPVIDGRIQFRKAKRINVGGAKAHELLLKTLQLKYPYLRSNITPDVAEELLYKFSHCSGNFQGQLAHLEKRYEEQTADARDGPKCGVPEELKGKRAQDSLKVYRDQITYENECLGESEHFLNEITVQIPFNPAMFLTEEQIKRKEEIRKNQGKRIREYVMKKTQERRAEMKNEYEELTNIEKLKAKNKSDFKECLLGKGFDSTYEFNKRIKYLAQKLKLKQPESVKDEGKYNLLSIPDDKLNTEQRKVYWMECHD
eukprot:TRINITY_DN10190_c0_g4_i1.p1 TRINITY_DN10190_c0_g4~~TRINITY_DN10190_c0_g4_i1.p1  ORF type:complete len:396 (-),score=134.50 TRINITY_DN10190_c0_g4_i1:1005-2192(-)